MQHQKEKLPKKIESAIGEVKGLFKNSDDIISVIKEDHKPLKELIQIMKDSDQPFAQRLKAFQDFAPLLLTHAKAEEKSLYDFMKTKPELKQHAFEGDTEHGLADQLAEEVKRSSDEDQLGAKIKVLAELVEHHLSEEEEDIFPEIKNVVDEKTLMKLTEKYVAVQTQIVAEGQDDAPHEKEIPKADLSH